MNFLITGVTGLVGSHILFELLSRIISDGEPITIHALVRSSDVHAARNRIRQILSSKGLPRYLENIDIEDLITPINLLPYDLNDQSLIKILKSEIPEDTIVIHSAASTNLMPGQAAVDKIVLNNRNGTLNFVDATKHCKKFVYISTAYSCGLQTDVVTDNYSNFRNSIYRSAYEENKAYIENHIFTIEETSNRKFQILRPSVVCGRLHSSDLYFTSKFDVFYGWAKFFWAYKDAVNREGIRIQINPEGTLNIVPVDYVAKAILHAALNNDIRELNIANATPPLHHDYFSIIL